MENSTREKDDRWVLLLFSVNRSLIHPLNLCKPEGVLGTILSPEDTINNTSLP